MTSRDKRLKFK